MTDNDPDVQWRSDMLSPELETQREKSARRSGLEWARHLRRKIDPLASENLGDRGVREAGSGSDGAQ